MKVNQLLPSVRVEVEKPFQEKLDRAKKLVKLFADKNACVSCSFGKDSTVVLWLCLQENPKIHVIYNNTGVEYPETLAFKEKLGHAWNLNLIETLPSKSFWQVANEKGLDDMKKYRDACCDALKSRPMRRVLKKHGFRYNFTGLTAVESRVRMWRLCQQGDNYYSRKDGVWRVHCIAYWTPKEVWDYIRRVQIPVNPAYEKYGLERLGCVPCTSHKFWRRQLAKVNYPMYKLVSEKYFGQKLLEVEG